MKMQGQVPKGRRRATASFIGSSMILFGGFNGDYFNDLYYINVWDTSSRYQTITIPRKEGVSAWVGR